MKKVILLTASLTLLIAFQSFTQYNHENLKIKKSAEFSSQTESTSQDFEQFDMGYSYENLRLYPIVANNQFKEEHKDIGRFTLLKDAIAQNKIVITETGASHLANGTDRNNINIPASTSSDSVVNPSLQLPNRQVLNQSINQGSRGGDVGGTVNTLFAQNNSQDTIFIMAGEVVKGGKQCLVL